MTCQPAVRLDCLTRTFADEFEALDLYDPRTRRGVWKTQFAHGPQAGPLAWDSRTLKGNLEQELYVDPAFPGRGRVPLGLNPFVLRDGVLSIEADRTPPAMRSRLWNYDYISGVLTTERGFAQTFGYAEIRARLPAGKGLWPAFWLLPKGGGWPPELDVFEQTGGDEVLQTVHMRQGGKPAEIGFRVAVPGATRGFHVYGVFWGDRRVTWFVDGKQTATADMPSGWSKPMYLLVNLAVGGRLPGAPDPHATWPAAFDIDYVRVYGRGVAAPGCEAAAVRDLEDGAQGQGGAHPKGAANQSGKG